MNTEAVGLRETGSGGVEVDLSDGSTVTGDVLLVATGRTPNGDQLDVAAAGLTLDAKEVCRSISTSAPRCGASTRWGM